MISESEALEKILNSVRVLPGRTLPLLDALGAFCARDVFAEMALPSFDNSSMDGFALRANASKAGARLRVIGEQSAGIDRALELGDGEAIRILTGAPIPKGADAVMMQEETSLEGDDVILQGTVEPGENIRRRGGDVVSGQKIAGAGDRLHPQLLALFAAQGLSSIEVGGMVRAAIISTGDELVAAGEKLQPGQIFDSNTVLLQTLLRSCGVEISQVTHCADRGEEIEAAMRAGARSDVMILTGGVSVGSRDFVKSSLRAIGATMDLWRVAVKPGKPFLFGRAGSCAVFGLPGNPVSTFVTFLVFVRPALLAMMGANENARSLDRVPAQLADEVDNAGDRRHYFRGFLRDGKFSIVGRQESHALFGLSRANALLAIEPGSKLAAGAHAEVLLCP